MSNIVANHSYIYIMFYHLVQYMYVLYLQNVGWYGANGGSSLITALFVVQAPFQFSCVVLGGEMLNVNGRCETSMNTVRISAD